MAAPATTPSVVLSTPRYDDQHTKKCLSADISYSSDYESQLDGDLPKPLTGLMAWSGASNGPGPYILQLTPENIAEVVDALMGFKALGLNGDEVNPSNFPLPNLRYRLERCAWEIHRGKGFCTIRGLSATRFCDEDNVIIFLGIASYLGNQRGIQDRKGNMLTHVTDSKVWTIPREKRYGIHANGSLPFHTDMGCDILSLQVRKCAREGGHTYVASASAVFNELVQSNPAVIETLSKPNWPIQISNKFGRQRFILQPLLTYHKGNLLFSMDPGRLGPLKPADSRSSSGASPDFSVSDMTSAVPHLTVAQKHALEVVQKSASHHRFKLTSRPGDLVFINNWGLIHARDAYQDSDDSSRHLVRLWLRNDSLAWPIPDSMITPWDAAYGATAKAVRNLYYEPAPNPEYMTPKYLYGSAAFVAEEEEHEGPRGPDAQPSNSQP